MSVLNEKCHEQVTWVVETGESSVDMSVVCKANVSSAATSLADSFGRKCPREFRGHITDLGTASHGLAHHTQPVNRA